ncbi:hypothetical protein L917_19649 [Phytophthora nicotianae]|uniref:Uncharacterized protein n=1 Tax=Phytophthora nicotianae TaxID=4792 RepID=W2K3N5_PHYNI|nr:hypothetical protein L917_19649 [Phytophthora nicotianae]
MAKSMIFMPPAEELAAVEDGFYATAGSPDTIGAETSSIGPQAKTCEETRVQFADWQVWWHRMETACDQSDEASGSLHLDSSRHTVPSRGLSTSQDCFNPNLLSRRSTFST